uniref:V-type proton ATPase subunit H n=1 Tax=Nannochloropsis gaditana (strain CCMP526) TaxID=1093141 RepID=I2CP76_NANGC
MTEPPSTPTGASILPAGSDSSEVLTDREQVLASFTNIQWDTYGRTMLDAGEVKILKDCDDKPLDFLLADPGDASKLVDTLLKLLNSVSDLVIQQYALTQLQDILSDNLPQRAPLFSHDGGKTFDALPFLRAFDGSDLYCKQSAATVMALLFKVMDGDLDGFVSRICSELSNSRNPSIKVIVSPLALLLRTEKSRLVFGAHGGVGFLTKLLKLQGSRGNAQLLYELIFCLWTLTFHEELKQDFIANGTVPVLAEQVSTAPREKVIRVSLAALHNLCYGRLDVLNAEMISCGLPKTLDNLLDRKWTDVELKTDLEHLHEALQKDSRELSTFERYIAEVASGQLRWGIVHSEKFWKENVRSLEADDFKVLKSLISLLASEDEEVVAIACYDIGEFARFYPNGRSIVKLFGAKDKAMHLIEHPSPEVSRYALQCVSKIMVVNWAHIRS